MKLNIYSQEVVTSDDDRPLSDMATWVRKAPD